MKAKWIGIVVAALMCVTALAACGPKTHTVTFYDGKDVMKTVRVETGKTVEDWTPEKEGLDFMGWFAVPSKTHRFDFSTAITEDTDVFVGFSKFQADTRVFSILGSGTSNLLFQSNWGAVITDDHKLAKTEGKNEYKITLDLLEGDKFQFALNKEWHNKRGYGHLTETKTADGKETFKGSGGIGDTAAKGRDIECVNAGNYTITLTTYPGDDFYDTSNPEYGEEKKEVFNIGLYDTITWVRNGDPQEIPDVVTDFYIKGSGITAWKDMYNKSTKMTNADDVYTLSVYLKAEEEFMFTSRNTVAGNVSTGTEYLRFPNLDEASQAFLTATASQNMVAKETGTYTFTYTKATGKLSVTLDKEAAPAPADYYADGTFGEEEDWKGYCFNDKYKFVEKVEGSGIFVLENVVMKQDSALTLQSFKKGSTEKGEWDTPTYNGLGSFNYTYLVDGGEAFTSVSATDLNIKVLVAGTYTITFDSYAKIITIVKVEA